MCQQVVCSRCGKITWAGCGLHVDQVMKNVPEDKRCQCPRSGNPVAKLFGR